MKATTTILTIVGALAVGGAQMPNEARMAVALTSTESSSTHWVWDCHLEEKLERGEIWASRSYDAKGKLYSGDFFHWNATGYDPSRPQIPIEWEIGYIWHPANHKGYDDRRAELEVRLQIEHELLNAALLQIQRPFPVEPHGVLGSTALTTTVFQNSKHDPNGGHGNLPLGDLLAYAGAIDELDWTITKVHDLHGHPEPIVSGKLDVAAFREASVAIPRLKVRLEKMASDFRANCKYEERMLPPIVY